jgi:hypothetical protein
MKRIYSVLALLLALSACSNSFRDLPDKSSDQYYIDQAQIYLNEFKFTEAIEKITPVLATQPNNAQVVQIAMLAHAGRAGLRVLDLILELGSDTATSTFFRIFAEHFPGSDDDDVADIQTAIDILETYQADATLRSSELNLIGMFLYYSRIGVVLHRYAYVNNVISPSFDQCSTTDLPDAALTYVVQSVPKAMTAASNISSGGVADALTSLTSAPEIQAFVGSETSTCPDDSQPCQSMRSLIGEGSLGIGLGSGAPAVCP